MRSIKHDCEGSIWRWIACLASATVLASSLSIGWAATVSVDVRVHPLAGGVFRYEFTVLNQGPEDVAIVSLVDAPVSDLALEASLTWPVGFFASYDSGLGFVDFLEDTAPFEPGLPVGGFSLESDAPPFTAFLAFESLDVDGGFTTGTSTIRVIDGGGGNGGVIPEPGRPVLALGSVAVCLLVRRRTRRSGSGALEPRA